MLEANMAKTKYEIELETKLFKAWADTVYADFRRKEALEALIALNSRVHSGYDFNADPDKITLMVGNVLADQQASNNQAEPLPPESEHGRH